LNHLDRKSGSEVKRVMGNIIHSIHHRIIKAEDVPTPPLRSLSEIQINIIKTTWEIPAAKVRIIPPSNLMN
jgi:hypothetical protein